MTARTCVALDPAVGTVAQIDALAEVVHAHCAAAPIGAPDWVVSHWVDHDPATGGAHLALSLEWEREVGADAAWECLLEAAEVVAGDPEVFGAAAELGRAAAGRTGGLPGLATAARESRAAHAARSSGRAIVFPGSARARGALTVAELLDATVIAEVTALGSAVVAPETVLHTFGHVRPVFRAGALVLPVVPYGAGDVTPFEVRHPTTCCADH